MTETAQIAGITLVTMDGLLDDGGQVTAGGTMTIWHTEDMQMARTLREQLCGLFGEPAAEVLLPDAAQEAIEKMRFPWPDSVKFDRDE